MTQTDERVRHRVVPVPRKGYNMQNMQNLLNQFILLATAINETKRLEEEEEEEARDNVLSVNDAPRVTEAQFRYWFQCSDEIECVSDEYDDTSGVYTPKGFVKMVRECFGITDELLFPDCMLRTNRDGVREMIDKAGNVVVREIEGGAA